LTPKKQNKKQPPLINYFYTRFTNEGGSKYS